MQFFCFFGLGVMIVVKPSSSPCVSFPEVYFPTEYCLTLNARKSNPGCSVPLPTPLSLAFWDSQCSQPYFTGYVLTTVQTHLRFPTHRFLLISCESCANNDAFCPNTVHLTISLFSHCPLWFIKKLTLTKGFSLN